MQERHELRQRSLESRLGQGYLFTFLVCCAVALAIYLPFLVIDKGLFQYCGDYNSQQIPFYTYMNGFVKSGPGQWSWETDLGTSAVNGYSFYLLGSPFFWLSALLPQAAVPFAMVPLLVLKFGVCGLGAFAWLRRYARTKSWAVVAACLYAFSGFTVYNTFFNHFVDCIALFPFLLWALDAYVYDGRHAAFRCWCLNCINNYFFFAGQIVFLLLYFFIKLASGEYRIKLPAFLRLAFESLLGCAMGCVLLVPAVSFLLGNPRTVDPSSGSGFLIYGRPQQYFAILTSLFLPPDPTYLPNIFTDCVIKHTSMTAYLPVVGAAGVFAYMGARKKKRQYGHFVDVPYHGAGAGVEFQLLRAELQLLRALVLYAYSYHVRGHHARTGGRGHQPDARHPAGGGRHGGVSGVCLCAQGGGRRMELRRGTGARAVLAYLAHCGAGHPAVLRHREISSLHAKILCRAAGGHSAVQRVLFRVPHRHGQIPPVGE